MLKPNSFYLCFFCVCFVLIQSSTLLSGANSDDEVRRLNDAVDYYNNVIRSREATPPAEIDFLSEDTLEILLEHQLIHKRELNHYLQMIERDEIFYEGEVRRADTIYVPEPTQEYESALSADSMFDFAGHEESEQMRNQSAVVDPSQRSDVREVTVRVGNKIERYQVPVTRPTAQTRPIIFPRTRIPFLSRSMQRAFERMEEQRQEPITDHLSNIER